MTAIIIDTNPRYTIRFIGNPNTFSEELEAIQEAVSITIQELKLTGHISITVVPSTTIGMDGGYGFGCYLEGIQVIAMGALMPENGEFTREQWLSELQTTAIHELVHYHQDINGQLYSDESEYDAEELTAFIRLKLRKIK